jgi:hypothetical protein
MGISEKSAFKQPMSFVQISFELEKREFEKSEGFLILKPASPSQGRLRCHKPINLVE